jgi:hypothetical protein
LRGGIVLSAGDAGHSTAEDVSRKLDLVLKRLEFLEKLIMEKPEYEGLAATLRLTKVGIGVYGEPLRVASRLKSAERYLREKTIAQDDISRCIVQALAVRGTMNVSGITRQVAAMRGKASRRIVRDRIRRLVEHGAITRIDGRIPVYQLVEKADQ